MLARCGAFEVQTSASLGLLIAGRDSFTGQECPAKLTCPEADRPRKSSPAGQHIFPFLICIIIAFTEKLSSLGRLGLGITTSLNVLKYC